MAAYDLLQEGGASYTFNCGNGRGYSVREVIRAVEAAAGRALRLTSRAAAPAIRRSWWPTRACYFAHVSWRPQYSLDDMVETALAWERRQAR